MSRRLDDGNDNEYSYWDEYDRYDSFDDPENDRRFREERRRVRRARREAEIRRKKRQALITASAAIGTAVVVLILVVFTRGGDSRSSSRESDAADVQEEDTVLTAEELSDDDAADTEDGESSGDDGAVSDGSEETETASEESEAALVYAYYETDDTILLSDSLTDISIYDAQRHITSTASSEETDFQEDGDDTIYGDSSDEASSEDGTSEDEQTANDDDYIDSQYVIVVNADTGEIIAERNAFEQIIPASMTKVMTLLVAIEAMEDYETALTDTFTITQEITDEAYLSGSSFVGYGVGDVATVEDLLYGTILPSGADAAMALAEYTAGTQEAFVEMMNEKVEELGLSATTHFTNVIGLYDDGENYSTPYDMCVIMNAAIDNEYCQAILSQRTWTTQAIMDNPDGTTISNWFLRRAEDHIDNWEVLCGKTGFVNESGNCAVSYMKSSVTGTNYIACTALTYSSWRCIFDHAAIYNYLTE